MLLHVPTLYALVNFLAASKLATDDFKKSIATSRLDEFPPEEENLLGMFNAVVRLIHQVPQLCDRIQFLGNLTQMGEAFMSGLRGDRAYCENQNIIRLQDLCRACRDWPDDQQNTITLGEDGTVFIVSA
jgi:hypothetical protein